MNKEIDFDTYTDLLISSLGGIDHFIKILWRCISIQEIQVALKTGDIHLVTIPLREWDKFHPYCSHFAGYYWSMSDTVCLMKRVARRWATYETLDISKELEFNLSTEEFNEHSNKLAPRHAQGNLVAVFE